MQQLPHPLGRRLHGTIEAATQQASTIVSTVAISLPRWLPATQLNSQRGQRPEHSESIWACLYDATQKMARCFRNAFTRVSSTSPSLPRTREPSDSRRSACENAQLTRAGWSRTASPTGSAPTGAKSIAAEAAPTTTKSTLTPFCSSCRHRTVRGPVAVALAAMSGVEGVRAEKTRRAPAWMAGGFRRGRMPSRKLPPERPGPPGRQP